MKTRTLRPIAGMLFLVMLISLACNLTSAPAPTATPVPPPTLAPTQPPPSPAPAEMAEPASGAVNTLKGARQAVVQIEAQGTFIDPQVGVIVNAAGRGSGFIIDPSGLAVTNNHVVTGAALLKVWVNGESEPRNAKVLGVSECSDLALIDIDGEGFSYLEWYPEPIEVGTDVYVAGFPLGDPEYTITKGVISKAKANGDTYWASVDSVIEYDATANPGNSGGPVIDPEGRVVAIHYASSTQTRQAYGISRDTAAEVIDSLRAGGNVDTLGINGQAVASKDESITGIWVASVQSGSPADRAGLEPGDILLMLENLVLAKDGTMADYCDILRSHQPGDTLSMRVLRWTSGEILEGQINGSELSVAMTPTPEHTPTPKASPTPKETDTPSAPLPTNTQAVSQGEQRIRVENNSGQEFAISMVCSGGPCQGKNPSSYSFRFPPGVHYFYVWPGRYKITWTICGKTSTFEHVLNGQWYIKLKKCN